MQGTGVRCVPLISALLQVEDTTYKCNTAHSLQLRNTAVMRRERTVRHKMYYNAGYKDASYKMR